MTTIATTLRVLGRARVALLSIGVTLAIAACGGSSGSTSSAAAGTGSSSSANTSSCPAITHPASTLVFDVDAFETDFDPASSYITAETLVEHDTLQSLVTLVGNSTTQTTGQLATNWSTNPSKSMWTFHLRPHVKFTDGTPFDAEAVKLNYVRTIALNLGTGAILGTYLPDPQKQIQVVNPLTVRFVFPRPVPNFDVVLSSEWGTQITSPAVFKEHSTGAKDQGHAWLQSHAVGTGPYIVQSIQPNNQVVLVRNPRYWGGWAGNHFDKIIINEVPNGSTRTQAVERGDADIAFAGTPQDTAALSNNPCVTVSSSKDVEMQYVEFGDYGPLANPKAREGLLYAFPYVDFDTKVMKNTLSVPHGVIPDLMASHDPNIASTTNLAKAKQLLTEGGVKPGTTLTYEYYGDFGYEPGLVLQAQLAQIDIHLKLIQKSAAAVNTDQTTFKPVSQRPNFFFYGWNPDYDNAADYLNPITDSDQTPAKCPCYNSGYYSDPVVDRFIKEGLTGGLSTAQFDQLSDQAQVVMSSTDPLYLPVGQEITQYVVRKGLTGVFQTPIYISTPDYYSMSRTS